MIDIVIHNPSITGSIRKIWHKRRISRYADGTRGSQNATGSIRLLQEDTPKSNRARHPTAAVILATAQRLYENWEYPSEQTRYWKRSWKKKFAKYGDSCSCYRAKSWNECSDYCSRTWFTIFNCIQDISRRKSASILLHSGATLTTRKLSSEKDILREFFKKSWSRFHIPISCNI